MSAKISGAVWDLDLPHHEVFVLLAMADHADHEGNNVFPSNALIAWKTGYSERHVIRVIDALVRRGVLVERARPGQTTLYSIQLSAVSRKPSLVHRVRSRQSATPDKMSLLTRDVTPDKMSPLTSGVSPPLTPDVTPTPDIQMSPEPSEEPSINLQLPPCPRDVEKKVAPGASAPEPTCGAAIVPPDELRCRLASAFRLSPHEVACLEQGDRRFRQLVALHLDGNTLDCLEQLWSTPLKVRRRGQEIFHATTLPAFLREPTADIGRAREFFRPRPLKLARGGSVAQLSPATGKGENLSVPLPVFNQFDDVEYPKRHSEWIRTNREVLRKSHNVKERKTPLRPRK